MTLAKRIMDHLRGLAQYDERSLLREAHEQLTHSHELPPAPPHVSGAPIPTARLDQIDALTHAMGMSVTEQRELVRGYRAGLAATQPEGATA